MIKWKRKKSMISIILVFSIISLCGVLLGINSNKKYSDKALEKEQKKEDKMMLEWKKENEENYKKLKEIFMENEEELNLMVENIQKEKLMDIAENMTIYLRDVQEVKEFGKKLDSKKGIYFYEGKLYEDAQEGSNKMYDVIKNNSQIYTTLQTMENEKIITEIIWTEGLDEIDFCINTDVTAFIKNNNGITNYFIYSEKENSEKYGYRRIKDNWYMWISDRPE